MLVAPRAGNPDTWAENVGRSPSIAFVSHPQPHLDSNPLSPLVINERFSVPATEDRVPHISLVLREMWDTTVLDAQFHRLTLGAHPTEPQLVRDAVAQAKPE
jgi:hypothetical protein